MLFPAPVKLPVVPERLREALWAQAVPRLLKASWVLAAEPRWLLKVLLAQAAGRVVPHLRALPEAVAPNFKTR
jgi:hypothetical protein